jgi:tRNA A-37 threonylcarbamoyl transferase component Bud32/tetratricopeptide (TPR) repeat protein
MSLVYLAHDLHNKRKVALKVLRPELTKSMGATRFLREIQIAANLEHPHILSLFDSGEADGLLYYTMPYVEGESLRDRLKRDGQLALEDALTIAKEVGLALAYAHAHGVVHRDIKPENILLTGGIARVADFGIARARTEAGEYESTTDANIAVGTPEYMSPEQAGGSDKIDGRTDIYSMGCVLYEMLAGEPPFTGKTVQAVIAKQLSEKVPTLTVVRPDIPLGVVRVVEKALAKVPADRHATAEEFVDHIDRSREPVPPEPPPFVSLETVVRTTRAHPIKTLLALVAGLAVSTQIVRYAVDHSRGPAFHGRPQSVVVVPFRTPGTTEAEMATAVHVTGLISRELNNWESIRALPRVSIAGPLFDLGYAEETLENIEDGVRVARDLGVQALVAVVYSERIDSSYVGYVVDANTGRFVGRPVSAGSRIGDHWPLVAAVVQGVLGLGDVPMRPDQLRRITSNPDALIQDQEGLRYLERWRLEEAESHFRQAIDLDSTFALALHHLALTLYWQSSQNMRRLRDLGPVIQQYTARAVRHSPGIPARDSLHIRAFHSFQAGDYVNARGFYRELLRADSLDVYAWLLLGSVEYRDPWLQLDPRDSSLAPRGNLNVSMRAFAEALRLQPGFDLGYGHRFDIHRMIWRAVDYLACPGFEIPREELIAHWEPVTPQQEIAYCPVAMDSIVWIRKAVFDTMERSEAARGADALVQNSLALLRRWAAYAPLEPKPKEEYASALLGQRARIGIGAPEIIDSLAGVALHYRSDALALKVDTAAADLLELGNLALGSGDIVRAAALTEAGMALNGEDAVPHLAANVLLARGQITRALDAVSSQGNRWFLPDTVADSLISYGGAEVFFDRIRVLGVAGVRGEQLQRELDDIRRLWSEPRYSARQVDLLRRDASLRIAVGLAFDHAAMDHWLEGLDLDSPLWLALVVSETDPTRARGYLQSSLETEIIGFSEAAKSFLHGLIAQRTSDNRMAVQQYSRLDSLPLSLTGFEPGWGLRSRSYLLRAESYEAMGDTTMALEYYQRFTDVWADCDSLGEPLLRSAEAAAKRLERS